jgi:hypothetical protein
MILSLELFLACMCFFSCRNKIGNYSNTSFKINPEISLLKDYYKNWDKFLFTYPVYIDSIKDISSIGKILDSICSLEPEKADRAIGIVYNLKDSLFAPSIDTSYNIIIPCGIGHPSHGKSRISSYSSLIKINNDSLTLFDACANVYSRMQLNNFKQYFKEYLIGYKIKDLPSDEYVMVTIDIANNPSKEAFKEIFETVFWNYYSEIFSKLKTNTKINLDNIILKSQTDSLMTNVLPQIRITLIRDNLSMDFRYQVLTPWHRQ